MSRDRLACKGRTEKADACKMLLQNREVIKTAQICVSCKQNVQLRNCTLRKGSPRYVHAEVSEHVWSEAQLFPLHRKLQPHRSWGRKRALWWASLPNSLAREGGRCSAPHRGSWHLGQPSERLVTAHTGCHIYKQEEKAISVFKWKICGSKTAAAPSQHSLELWENESTITGKQNKAASPDM